jgi:hypothetical protein
MTSVSDGAEMRAWLDRLAIQDVINRYSDAVTRADYEQMATVFTADALWESPLLGLRFESARAFIDFQIEGSPRLDVLIQTPHCSVIDLVDAERATATTTIHEMIRGTAVDDSLGEVRAAMNVDQYGIYFDDIVKADDVWKFSHRLFAPYLVAPGHVVGDVISHRPLVRPT